MTNNVDLDLDVTETEEWLEAIAVVLEEEGPERAHFLIEQLIEKARRSGVNMPHKGTTAYLNSILTEQQAAKPGSTELEKKIEALLRWNAVAMVLQAGRQAPELGGHIASYASSSTLYEVGFNHFFHAANDEHGGDLLYIQGHSSPGIYARAFLEGRISEDQIKNFRQEVSNGGVSSYPHPWLMPDFWQFPTVSMGLGPLAAIYQARFLKYLDNRGLSPLGSRKVWCFCGDGEMDEPESLGAISLAGREELDNLIFVVNCNLQRLDGPVRGNGKIIQELEGIFRGAGWNVLKVIWGSQWDPLLEVDESGKLQQLMEETLDGDYQNCKAHGGAYTREHFFGKYPETKALVENFTDEEVAALNRGGHDPEKVYAAYHAATKHKGQPTVILAKTVKGYGMGAAGEAQNTTHQQKKMKDHDLKAFRDRFDIPVTDEQIENLSFCKPADDSEEMQYLQERRAALGGYLPSRKAESKPLSIPPLSDFDVLLKSTGERQISTTMAFVRFLNILLKNKEISKFIVPIVPDEARTFGMEGMFRQYGIYSSVGQLYKPVDSGQVMYYREDQKGQVLEEGLTEAGGISSWMAAGTSYANSNTPMIPFYVFYSMFGFQRVGDFAWMAGDAQTKGFLLGATSGRTTLAGEGLQHQDGNSLLISSMIPNCVSYDPTFAYEVAVIMQDGLRRMYAEDEKVFYYITIMNENYHQPDMPEGAEEGIIKGMYKLQASTKKSDKKVRLLGSGTILREVIAAAEILEADYGVAADVWSVTSFTELKRDGIGVERHNRLHPEAKPQQSYVEQQLGQETSTIIAATDYVRSYADQIRFLIDSDYVVLGTDGYGRSDTRAQLRHFFEVDAKSIVIAALKSLADRDEVSSKVVAEAIKKLGVDTDKPSPWSV